MSGWDDVSAPAAQSSSNPWDSVSAPIEPPKVPDMSGMQKTAQDNLAANDNTTNNPAQKLDTAMGMPASSILSGNAKDTPIPVEVRGHYVDALKNGSADSGTDFMQSAIMSITPIISRLGYTATHPAEAVGEIGTAAKESVKGAAGLLAYPFLSQENKEALLENEQLSDYKNPEKPATTETIRRGEELEQATLGKAMGGLYWPISALLSPTISPIIQGTGGEPTKAGDVPSWQSLIPGAIGTAMDIAGGLGIVHGANELRKTGGSSPSGSWDNLPGHDNIREIVAKSSGKDVSAISSSDIDTAIAKGAKDIFPHGQDFHDVATVMGHDNPDTLHEIYRESGVKPDQVFADAQHDPQIATEVAEGKIPQAYKNLIEPKEEKLPLEKEPVKEPQELQVKVSEDKRGFNVVDKDGDHVQGGFDSYDDAKQFIEDRQHGQIPEEPPEWAEKEKTSVIDKSDPFYKYQNKLGRTDEEISEMQQARIPADQTALGQQAVIPGAERINDKQLAERNMQQPLREKVAQKADIGGMFDTESRRQMDLLDTNSTKGENVTKENPNEQPLSGHKGIEGNSVHPESIVIGDKETAKLIGSRGARVYSTDESVRKDLTSGQLNQVPEKAGICFQTAGEVAEAFGKNMVIGTVDRGGKRIYHAVNYVNEDGRTYIYDGTFDKIFTPEIYSKFTKWTPVKELTPSEVTAHGRRFNKWPAPDDLGLPKPYAVEYGGKQEIPSPIIDNGREVKPSIIPPSGRGSPTSLSTFLRNNGGKFDQNGELISIRSNGNTLTGDGALDHAGLIAQDHGYFKDRPLTNDLQNTLRDTDGGRDHFRDEDAERLAKREENAALKRQNDLGYIEHEAALAGVDTNKVAGETDRQRSRRLLKALEDIYRNEQGQVATDLYRKAVGNTIISAEKFAGKLTGNLFQKLADGYIKTFQPELVGDKAKRADAYMAKYKTALQEAENSYYRQSETIRKAWDKASPDERMQWIDDHETGRWNEKDNPDHARTAALLDATFKAEKEAIGGDPDKGYKENYLPLQFEDPDAVNKYFRSDVMVKKYGANWFTKARVFDLIQDAVRAGFKLKTDNPEAMLLSRLLAGHNMIATMDLLHDMESNGLAKPARIFSVGKRIAKTEGDLKEAQERFNSANDKINDPRQLHWSFADPAVSRYMKHIQERMDNLQSRLDDFNKEKTDNKLTSDQMKELKDNGFKVIGPDSKVWNIHQEVGPLWKNAIEMKGLWENQGVIGDAYRAYTGAKALWTQAKLGLSLFHPFHEAIINVASGLAATADNLIKGGSLSGLALKDTGINMGLGKETLKGQDHPSIVAWNTAPEARTPEQQQIVSRMVEGGLKPTMSARDTVHFRENFDKAINGVGLNNLRLIGTAIQLPGLVMKPFLEHWIPGMKSEIYLRRYQDALDRDPTLATDAGRRGEMAREIAKDTDRTYGEMNNDVQFWNKNVRDSFNAAFISGGWKLAQIYNARGLLQPLKIAYNFAKTGEFSKDDITYNMLHAYIYTALTLATGAAVNTMLGNPIGTAKDTVWDVMKNLVAPQTGEKNSDGTPIRLNQPAFAKEAYSLAHDINTKGLIFGTGSFLYHQTLLPGIADTLGNRDFTGRELISDPTDLHQWANAGWDFINPIAASTYEKAEAKQSKVGKIAAFLGFPMAGAYINQTPFEQKVIALYDEQHPPKGDVYSAKLRAELKSAMATGNTEKIEGIKQNMRQEGMSDKEISSAAHVFTKPFVDVAWKKLSVEDQKRLIDSASEEEKKLFKIK